MVGGKFLIGASIGLFIAAGITGLEIFIIQRRPGEILRRSPLPVYILITTLLWLVVICAGLQLVPALYLGMDYITRYEPSHFARDLFFAFSISLINNSIFRIRSLVGPGVFLRFLFGRYHRPKREERVFLFLDMANSTRLAEELGDLQVQSLISRFFFDIAQPVARYRGETHRYIGDEVVVTWTIEKAIDNSACIRCITDIHKLMFKRAHWYQKNFGTIPAFRIGMHCGSVVASEVGDNKREIVYFGDTINTAARLCSACKKENRDILISRDLTDRLTLPQNVQLEPLDSLQLDGKSQPVAVATLEFSGIADSA